MNQMKILVAGHSAILNPFLTTLADCIKSELYDIQINLDVFWHCNSYYNIVHIHWPELLFNWNIPTEEQLQDLRIILTKWKRYACIIYTRHNEMNHYHPTNIQYKQLYEIIESTADIIVHLGNFSKAQFIQENRQKKLQIQKHYVIPHHIYDTIYSNKISRPEARNYLGISHKKTVILSFGAFRHTEEQLLIINAFKQMKSPDIFLLAPSWYSIAEAAMTENYIFDKNAILGKGTVSDFELPYYFTAADIVLIQRLKILNSGNLPMGFLFNKTIVGPNIGNITELLDNKDNFLFDPYTENSISLAIEKAIEKASTNISENEQYAKSHWATTIICEQYKKVYNSLK